MSYWNGMYQLGIVTLIKVINYLSPKITLFWSCLVNVPQRSMIDFGNKEYGLQGHTCIKAQSL